MRWGSPLANPSSSKEGIDALRRFMEDPRAFFQEARSRTLGWKYDWLDPETGLPSESLPHNTARFFEGVKDRFFRQRTQPPKPHVEKEFLVFRDVSLVAM